jgi:four helix bundle protein
MWCKRGKEETEDEGPETGAEDKKRPTEMDDERPETGHGRENGGRYKFQRLQVYQLALDHLDIAYRLTARFPRSESLNLGSQLERASTSIVLNIAKGSTGQTDAEQARFLGLALLSLMECVACLDVVERRALRALDRAQRYQTFRFSTLYQNLGNVSQSQPKTRDGRRKTKRPLSVRGLQSAKL